MGSDEKHIFVDGDKEIANVYMRLRTFTVYLLRGKDTSGTKA
jgi:hypothetical protein